MRTLFRLQKYLIFLLFLSFLLGMIIGIAVVTSADFSGGLPGILQSELNQKKYPPTSSSDSILLQRIKDARDMNEEINNVNKKKGGFNNNGNDDHDDKSAEKDFQHVEKSDTKEVKYPEPNYNVHVFYYLWYGTPEFDDRYYHWNHAYLQHWDKKEAKQWPAGNHVPPDDIAANYYPALGPYSSKDPAVMEDHMRQIRSAGIGVLAVSWYPPGQADDNGKPWDDIIPDLLDMAEKYKLKVCFHIEPFKGRNRNTMKLNIRYIIDHYGPHPAFYRYRQEGKDLPFFYIYDSYLVKREEWSAIFNTDGAMTLRGTQYDGVFIGLLVDSQHKVDLITAGFDGFYTYFASDGFTYGSNTRHWTTLANYASQTDTLFIPSVGPGYMDERVRPWNAINTKDREHGGYYEQSFKAATLAKPAVITITSFNEWHEGSQIERAVPHGYHNFQYLDYSPESPDYYLAITRKWIHKYSQMKRS